MSNSPSNGIPYVPQGTQDPAAGLNLAINVIDALLQSRVINMTTTAPPGSPADGDQYIVAAGATGAWATHDHSLARWVADGAFWQFYPAGVQSWVVLDRSSNSLYTWSGSAWVAAAGITDAPVNGNSYGRRNGAWVVLAASNAIESINGLTPDSSGEVELDAEHVPFSPNTSSGLTDTNVESALNTLGQKIASSAHPLQSLVAAVSDETTALTTGTAKVTFRNPYASAFIVTHVKASLTTAQATGGTLLTVDIKESGTSILSTKLTFDNTEKTTETAATPPVISDNSIAADAEITGGGR